MKKIYIFLIILIYCSVTNAQKSVFDSLTGFDHSHVNEHLSQIKDKQTKENYLTNVKRSFINRKNNLINETKHLSASSTSTCGNLDFEDGNVNGWTTSGDFQIMSGSGVDPYAGYPVVCPGGNFSLRLNDDNVLATTCSTPGTKSNYKASASNTISITAANPFVKVNFATCFLAYGHVQTQAANARIEFYDMSNNLISAPGFTAWISSTIGFPPPPGTIVATSSINSIPSSIQGFQLCNNATCTVAYSPWQQNVFNLSAHIGQTIKIKLSADWCTFNYDWAYAYFDVCCDSSCSGILTDVKNLEKDYLTMYPNPFKNEIVINKATHEASEFILYNCLGQEVLRKRLTNPKNIIETECFPQGLYIYSIEQQNKPIKQGKLLKD